MLNEIFIIQQYLLYKNFSMVTKQANLYNLPEIQYSLYQNKTTKKKLRGNNVTSLQHVAT